MRRPLVGESYIVQATNKAAKAAGFLHRKVVYQNRRGAPDDWYFGPGPRLIIVEHKRPGEAPKPQQDREIARLRKMGFEVHVVDSVDTGPALFRDRRNSRGDDLI